MLTGRPGTVGIAVGSATPCWWRQVCPCVGVPSFVYATFRYGHSNLSLVFK